MGDRTGVARVERAEFVRGSICEPKDDVKTADLCQSATALHPRVDLASGGRTKVERIHMSSARSLVAPLARKRKQLEQKGATRPDFLWSI